ncbi:MAG TPA: hypothetical protein EYH48_01530 [Aquifex aeolicus]|nr:hypothetical protein [Aquificales bacterium]HIQ26005.1 hypothetical protein [Aquifex aeolicus]
MFKFLLTLISLVFSLTPSFAEGIKIDAKSFKAYGENKVSYTGNVKVTIGSRGELTCDVLTVYLNDKGDVKKVSANGHVRYSDETYTIVGKMAEYDPINSLVIFTGNVVVKTESGILKGDKAFFNLKTKRFEMFSNEKVRTVFKIQEKVNGEEKASTG